MTATAPAKHNPHQPRTIAITGGKGGVGKTSLALNLALTLARQDNRVLLLDGDTDLANVSIMVGLYPQKTLANVMAGECRLEDVILETDYGLHIVPGASGVQECMDMGQVEGLRILRALYNLESRYDYVITDTAAGLQAVGLHMIAATELACMVVTPDPASLTDAFSLIKVLRRRGYNRVPSILVNMAQGASQARSVFQRLDAAAQRHLGLALHYMGGIWRDETLRQSVLNQKPVALLPVSDPSCRQFHTLADMLNVRLSQLPRRKAGIAAYWHRVSRREGVVASPPGASSPESAAAEEAPAPDIKKQCFDAVGELEAVFSHGAVDPLLRYEAFTRLFALLGSKLDSDAIEIIQTGLAALPWENLSPERKRHLASHLRELADQVAPAARQPTPPEPGHPVLREPFYDRVSFGEQDRLVRVLKEQPADISLDQLLRSLSGNDQGGS
ncbi:MinD/ParA family ATP-binding protein [Marinobacter subterrani]|uniref:MinD/ParA family ATP-binding protein n=1 Tax=Marinobacter subterrani TaxID=1658765 RepID=UPI002353F128|nr:AAA family ATPase [Marinobacter subterrani]